MIDLKKARELIDESKREIQTSNEEMLIDSFHEALDEIESLRKRLDDAENAMNDVPKEMAATFARLELAEKVCEAATSVASEDTVRHELLAYNMGLEMINRLEEWRKGEGK